MAALAGLWPGEGSPYPLTTFRSEMVTINARSPYYRDTVSSAAQLKANDLVTLVPSLPLLAVSFWLASRGSLRGRILLAGTPGFILYIYTTMCFGTAYNPLFLVYVAVFSLSLFAFILVMMSFTLGIAVNLMGLNMARVGAPVSIVDLDIFLAIALTNLVMSAMMLKNIS